jgi:hypothetical protein
VGAKNNACAILTSPASAFAWPCPGRLRVAGQLLFVTFLSIWQFLEVTKLYFRLATQKRPGEIQGAVSLFSRYSQAKDDGVAAALPAVIPQAQSGHATMNVASDLRMRSVRRLQPRKRHRVYALDSANLL